MDRYTSISSSSINGSNWESAWIPSAAWSHPSRIWDSLIQSSIRGGIPQFLVWFRRSPHVVFSSMDRFLSNSPERVTPPIVLISQNHSPDLGIPCPACARSEWACPPEQPDRRGVPSGSVLAGGKCSRAFEKVSSLSPSRVQESRQGTVQRMVLRA
jgi:hypothetical protein